MTVIPYNSLSLAYVSLCSAVMVVLAASIPGIAKTEVMLRNELISSPDQSRSALPSWRDSLSLDKLITVQSDSSHLFGKQLKGAKSRSYACRLNAAGQMESVSAASIETFLTTDSDLQRALQSLEQDSKFLRSYDRKARIKRRADQTKHFYQDHKYHILGGVEAFPL